ncbi:MAG TPA: ATP-binding protein [Polyangiaceae bacterium]|nr:ATP-binding protein [Polyangiaceae bacterium]
MSHSPLGFAEQYAGGLDAYLAAPSDEALGRARALGELALANGIGSAQLVSLHAELVGRHAAFAEDGSAALRRTSPFLAEALRAFDRELTELRRAHAAVKHSAKQLDTLVTQGTERYRAMFDDNPMPMWIYDCETLNFVLVNDAAVSHYGYSREEFTTMTLADIRPPEDVTALRENVARATRFDEGGVWRHRKKDGSILHVEVRAHEFEVGNRPVRLVLCNDVTLRAHAEEALRKTEEQLRHAQKMEAVGRLAGGVAHDFNNLLSVILSYADLLLADLKPVEPMREEIDQIRKAAQRAADLTRRLLTFSRQQVIDPKIIDLNDVLEQMNKMLQRIIGGDVELVLLCARSLGRMRADRGSIEQVIMNLVVNARDAMPTGGKLTMETANVMIDEERARGHLGTSPGPHVMLAVSDTGVGMDRATQGRIFEPFFTTKETGKGTGLGLSTVFGIVQQSGGSIWVYSEPGRGTSFKVYFPCVDGAVDEVRSVERPATLRGSETVLLVEDDEQVRAVARGILRRHGYRVLEARNGGEAMLLCESHDQPIHLLISDVVMPLMSGPELARRLAQGRPEMKVLCMSGYTDDSVVRHGVMDSDIAYLQKPITPEALTRKVREVLDARGRASGP